MKRYTSCILMVIIMSGCNLNTNKTDIEEQTPDQNESAETGGGVPDTWPEYASTRHHLSLAHPREWSVMEFNFGENIPIINVIPEADRDMVELPLTVHAIASVTYVGIYPEGYGTELPMGKNQPLNGNSPVNFNVNNNESKVFLLENGDP